jgi:hypothetical protein
MSSHTKGNLFFDGLLIVIVLIAFGLFSVIGYRIFNDINDDIQADASLSNQTKAVVENAHDAYPNTMDSGFLIILGLFWIMTIVASVLIDTHPMFLVISIILFLFLLGIAMMLSNSFQEVVGDAEFSGFESAFPYTYYVIEHLLQVILVYGASIMIAMFAKTRFT